MLFWLGVFLLITGGIPFLFNEFTVNVRRTVKPWWRDDANPVRDQAIKEVHRLVAYFGSILSLEVGFYLTGWVSGSEPIRGLIYLGRGMVLFWRRRLFWFSLVRRKPKG